MGPDATPVEILRETRRIAMVGVSDDPDRPALGVMGYLLAQGYEVVPVHPKGGVVHGRRVVPHLEEIEGPIDVVDVFRRSDAAPEIARQAVAIGAGGLWLQPGCVSDEAGRIAREAGLAFVQDQCMRKVHRETGVGPVGPSLAPA